MKAETETFLQLSSEKKNSSCNFQGFATNFYSSQFQKCSLGLSVPHDIGIVAGVKTHVKQSPFCWKKWVDG